MCIRDRGPLCVCTVFYRFYAFLKNDWVFHGHFLLLSWLLPQDCGRLTGKPKTDRFSCSSGSGLETLGSVRDVGPLCQLFVYFWKKAFKRNVRCLRQDSCRMMPNCVGLSLVSLVQCFIAFWLEISSTFCSVCHANHDVDIKGTQNPLQGESICLFVCHVIHSLVVPRSSFAYKETISSRD